MLGGFVLSGPCGQEKAGKSTAKAQRREGLPRHSTWLLGGLTRLIGVFTHFTSRRGGPAWPPAKPELRTGAVELICPRFGVQPLGCPQSSFSESTNDR